MMGDRLVAKCGGHTDGVGAVAFSKKTNNFVVTGSEDKTIKLWDLAFLSHTSVSAQGMHVLLCVQNAIVNCWLLVRCKSIYYPYVG